MGGGGVSPAHFFYDMSTYEMEHFIKGREEAQRVQWEQTRMIVIAVLQSRSGTQLDKRKVFPLPWDDDGLNTSVPTEQDIKELQELADRLSNGEK